MMVMGEMKEMKTMYVTHKKAPFSFLKIVLQAIKMIVEIVIITLTRDRLVNN